MLGPVKISKHHAVFTIAVSPGALIGPLLGWAILSHLALFSVTVLPAALEAAYKAAGSSIHHLKMANHNIAPHTS
jgi:hypothetical protein